MAGAPEGNNNAEKWTIELAQTFLNDILKYVQENKKCRSLSEAAVECGEYEEVISYLQNKFNTIDFKSIKRAKDIVKNRLAQQGLDGEANPTMAIFLLKNNHNMTDKQQTDVTTNGKDLNTAPIIKFVDSDDGD
jgi:hypothetical protein